MFNKIALALAAVATSSVSNAATVREFEVGTDEIPDDLSFILDSEKFFDKENAMGRIKSYGN